MKTTIKTLDFRLAVAMSAALVVAGTACGGITVDCDMHASDTVWIEAESFEDWGG